MNKGDLIKAVAEELSVSKANAAKCVSAVLGNIKKGLKSKAQKVQIIGFGTFVVRKRKARKGLNPRTREQISIAAAKTIGFRPGKELKSGL